MLVLKTKLKQIKNIWDKIGKKEILWTKLKLLTCLMEEFMSHFSSTILTMLALKSSSSSSSSSLITWLTCLHLVEHVGRDVSNGGVHVTFFIHYIDKVSSKDKIKTKNQKHMDEIGKKEMLWTKLKLESNSRNENSIFFFLHNLILKNIPKSLRQYFSFNILTLLALQTKLK